MPGELTARVDSGRIRQAVDNLVDNALRFAPAGIAIRITGRWRQHAGCRMPSGTLASLPDGITYSHSGLASRS
ncbi:MAG: hypothetical protein ACLQFR_08295 [Streptosporangiaceae bacterium]